MLYAFRMIYSRVHIKVRTELLITKNYLMNDKGKCFFMSPAAE